MPPRVAVISLEPWDDVWRRNQHLVAALLRQRLVEHVVFIEPPSERRACVRAPWPGVTAVRPPLLAKPRYGSLALAGLWLRRKWLKDVDRVWVNNAPLGRWVGSKVICYDVTDDWRSSDQGRATRTRLLRAESRLARRARTIVCSPVLQRLWRERYGVEPSVVPNGVDAAAIEAAVPRDLSGPAPHLCYVGTLHRERIDVALVCQLAHAFSGTIHLVGPDLLDRQSRALLAELDNIHLVGPVLSEAVPSWLVSADVLLLPHLVSPFTLSLDAIKAYEYLSTDRQVVATPTSGFQTIHQPGVRVVAAEDFVAAVLAAIHDPAVNRDQVPDWSERARQFAALAWGGT